MLGKNDSVEGEKMRKENALTRKKWSIILNAVEKLIQIVEIFHLENPR